MCGRSSLTKKEVEIEKRFNATFYTDELERYNPLPNFNVAPTHMHPVITNIDLNHIQLYRWGLIPRWAKDAKIGSKMINARVESLLEKPVFSQILNSKRCIIPFDGFYEWKSTKDEKIPFRIQVKDCEIFSVAGLWETWKSPEGVLISSFTIITLPANEFMLEIHDRMPAILTEETEQSWLHSESNEKILLEILKPFPSESMTSYMVSPLVNSVKNNDERLILPYTPPTKVEQMSLF